MGEMPAITKRGGNDLERKTIEIEQEVERHGQGDFSVLVTVTDEGVHLAKEYSYFKCNTIYPAYKSLIATLRNYKDVDVLFTSNITYLVMEINVIHEVKNTLAKILSDVLMQNNITIKAV